RLSPPRTHHLRISSEPMNHDPRSAASAFFNSLLDLYVPAVGSPKVKNRMIGYTFSLSGGN
ncbi:hypothetical protein, partial [Bradyrhizobium sp. 33ap4]|uniref:hypothetical protein n=1 Tax=Bradyrhizobium sp. 33ap4 TaxID=3061630 RepID=UPI0029309F45